MHQIVLSLVIVYRRQILDHGFRERRPQVDGPWAQPGTLKSLHAMPAERCRRSEGTRSARNLSHISYIASLGKSIRECSILSHHRTSLRETVWRLAGDYLVGICRSVAGSDRYTWWLDSTEATVCQDMYADPPIGGRQRGGHDEVERKQAARYVSHQYSCYC